MASQVRRSPRRVAALVSLALLVFLQLPVAGAARRTASSSKEADSAQLVQLDAVIANLKTRVGADPTNTSLVAKYNAAVAQYNAISVRLGGDRAPSQLPPDLTTTRGAGVPSAPPGCAATTTTFANSTATPIPDNDPTGISPTVSVTGVGPYVYDVNVTVNITHTFASDLDYTLTSPAGTVVTLSTDNGGSNDNVFAPTTFDDSANPGSAIPYVTAPNQVVDNTYVNLTAATSLTPEEPLGAFIGEDPNGTWTLHVIDDAGADTGTLNSWSIDVTTLAVAPTLDAPATFMNSTSTAIPDNDPTGISPTVAVTGLGTSIIDVNATVNITHTFSSDLDFTLTSPGGTIVTLSTDNGSSNDNVFAGTTFDDQANLGSPIPYGTQPNQVVDNTYVNLTVAASLTPEEPLSAFVGEDPNGTWTLHVIDDAGADLGTLNSWSVTITTASCAGGGACTLTCPPDQTAMATDTTGANVNYPAPTTTGTCGTVTCLPASGSQFPVGTTTVTCTESGTPSVATATNVYSSGNIAIAIPDNTPAGVSATINVPDPGTITDVNVRVRANHTWDADLAFTLTSPNNTTVALITNRGSSSDNFGTGNNDCSGVPTVLDDEAATAISAGAAPFAGSFIPEAPLSAYDGLDQAGTWTLHVVDSANADTGTIGCFELEITSDPVGGGGGSTCSFNVTVALPFDGCCVDDASGDTFQAVVASVPSSSPLYGSWQYTVAATGETFSGTANIVAYRPGASIVMRDTVSPNVAMYSQTDFSRHVCLVQVTDRLTGRQFVLRDRNINNSTCGAPPPPPPAR